MSEARDEIIRMCESRRLKVWPAEPRAHFKFSWPADRPRREPSEAEKIDQAIGREVLRLLPWHKEAP